MFKTIRSDDLYERAKRFALNCANLGSSLPKTTPNITYFRQLVRSSSSIGANYIEAQEASGDKDFAFHLKICRKEAKESRHWLDLLFELNKDIRELGNLRRESDELVKIFSKAVITAEKRQFAN